MRRPPETPQWYELFSKFSDEEKAAWSRLAYLPEVVDLVRRANDRYVHWHKFRYWPLPPEINREQAWAAVQWSRKSQRQDLPIAFSGLKDHVHYWNPPQHQAWLHRIDHEAGGLIGGPKSAILEDQDRYLFSSLMEEAIASSQIEGAVTTRKVAKQMLRGGKKPRNRSEQMIVNNYATVLEIRDLLREELTPDILRHLHRILTEDTLDNPEEAGHFRKKTDNVRVVDAMTEEVLHDPPHRATLDYRLEEICDFANEESQPFIHPVVKAIVLHFAIGFVHPFTDGNGRTARAVFYWYMLKHGYRLFEYLSISRIVFAAPAEYGRAYLFTETDGGDATYFIHYHLRVVIRAIRDLHKYLATQHRKTREAGRLVEACPGINHRQSALLHEALKTLERVYTIRQHEGTHHVTYATARSDLLGLEEMGFLSKSRQGKKLVFCPVPDLVKRLPRIG